MHVIRIVNTPVTSNSYIVWQENCNQCIIIDPGSPTPWDLIEQCSKLGLTPIMVLLTHHHFDHVWGADAIRQNCGCTIACSRRCAERLRIPQNYFNLLYFNDESMFCIKNIDIQFDDLSTFECAGFRINAIPTPGHTNCSVCISIADRLFTGDTIMKGYKPVIKKSHGGSIDNFKESIESIFDMYPLDTIVYPGHGDGFELKDVLDFYKSI